MVWHLQWKMVYQTNGYKWDFPINHGRPPSDVRGCRFTCAGGVSSREQFVSGALSVTPSTTRVLYLYDVVWDLPEKWVFQTSSSFQARILCGWSFFFPDDCWILTGQLWDVGWLWWLNWKSHTIPTIPWVSSEFLQVYHQFREFRSSLFQESVAAESDSWDITLIVQRVVFSCFFNDQDSSIFQSMIVLMAFTSVPCASRSYTLQRQTFKSFNGLAKMHHEPCITSLIKWCSPKSSKWCMIKLCITPW